MGTSLRIRRQSSRFRNWKFKIMKKFELGIEQNGILANLVTIGGDGALAVTTAVMTLALGYAFAVRLFVAHVAVITRRSRVASLASK